MNDEEPAGGAEEPEDRPAKPHARSGSDTASKLRAQAAVIGIEMEQGRWIDPGTGQRWPEGKALSKSAIARAMGYSVANGKALAFMREPEFARAVEYERIRRETDGTLTPQRLSHLLSVANRGMLAEITRRVLLDPQSIPDRTLYTEARKFLELQAALVRPEKQKDDVEAMNALAAQIRLLPPSARESIVRTVQEAASRYLEATRTLDSVLEPSQAGAVN